MKERKNSSANFLLAIALLLSMIGALPTFAQQTTGNIRGTVTDQNGAAVPGAQVTLTNPNTKTSQTAQSSTAGEYQFNNLLSGDYTLRVEATNFKALSLNNVRVQLNQTTDVPAQLQIGVQTETVEVSAGGAELIDTTTTTLSKTFNERQVVELAQTNVGGAFGGGVNNLALLAPNVSSAGGVGAGSGGSVGGQRPRNNNFIVDGVDNNDKGNTGPQIYVSPDVVSEFSLLQNQFSAEFSRSNGGQFITVTKSGSNDFHGTGYGFFRNRYLNALDTAQKNAGVTRNRADGELFMPRADFFRGGANVGGPIYLPKFGEGGSKYYSGKNKLFFFTAYERLQHGDAASPGGVTSPTAAGFAILDSIPGLSPTNYGVFKQFVPVASRNDAGFIQVQDNRGAPIEVPIGNVTYAAPSFNKQNYFLLNIDYTQSERTQQHGRFSMVNNAGPDILATLPVFFVAQPIKQRLFSYTLLHTFSPNLTNETRLAFRRSETQTPVGPQVFPGLSVFPNITLLDLGLDIGPDTNAPQFNIENNYQIVDNLSYQLGKHSLKFGGDFRRIISPQTFVQRQRGEYAYNATDLFLRDISPDNIGERNVGTSPYIGDQKVLYTFVQDDWRLRPNLTLNLGVNYSYQGVPRGAEDQARNALASVPGLIEFRKPKPQLKNFAPKVGFAYSPEYTSGLLGRVFGSGGKSSIRGGFSLGYDYIFDNLYILSYPPQAQQTVDINLTTAAPNFLANGAIPDAPTPITDPTTARGATSSYIPDQKVPYAITYSLSMQRQFRKDYSVEIRYVGTRGVHLFTQNRINRQSPVSVKDGLPTYLQSPSQAQLDALNLTLDDLNAVSSYVPAYDAAGFNGADVVGFLSNGNSIYHSGSASLQKRFSEGLQMTAAYTYSHLIDDSTAEVNSTVLTPRRAQDFLNLRAERSDSQLDRRHRFVLSSIYELPFFKNDSNHFRRALLGGFNFAGTLIFESGEKATVLSGIDSNLNGDGAGDRTILNVNGAKGTGSDVTALTNSTGQIVAYLADNPNAQYIRAGSGAIATAGRNTLQMPGINNLDFSIFKNFRTGETSRIQLRADFFNAFNHPQYVPGALNDVSPVPTDAVNNVNTVTAANVRNNLFNNPSRTFISNARVVQLALRFDF